MKDTDISKLKLSEIELRLMGMQPIALKGVPVMSNEERAAERDRHLDEIERGRNHAVNGRYTFLATLALPLILLIFGAFISDNWLSRGILFVVAIVLLMLCWRMFHEYRRSLTRYNDMVMRFNRKYGSVDSKGEPLEA